MLFWKQLKFVCLTLSLVYAGMLAFRVGAEETQGGGRMGDKIMQGMDYQQVLKVWGAPLEKQEYESKREDLWLYHRKEIRFKEGRVMEIKEGPATGLNPQAVFADKALKREVASTKSKSEGDERDVQVMEEILTEIMKGSSVTKVKNNDDFVQKPPVLPHQSTFIHELHDTNP